MTFDPNDVLIFCGSLSEIFILYRIFLKLDQEFSDDDKLVKDPFTCAASTTIDFNKFKEDSWKGFQALWAAIRFRTFYKRFTPLISPREAKLCGVVMAALFVVLVVVAQMTNVDPSKGNRLIGAAAMVWNTFWAGIIEHGKTLKKSVEKLQTRP